LEDCNEAILRIKMSFKSGHVNLAPEHITAQVNAITLADSMTAFDMLLPEPLLAYLILSF
jgi:cohesin complex subunit SCC1